MKKNEIFTPPEKWDSSNCCVMGGKSCPVKVFLAGTIDNGDSENWQDELINIMNDVELRRPTSIYNPRREQWPSSDDHHEIDKQIEWELYHLEKADIIIMNILATSKSPISLMELGLFAREGRLMVFCPKTFYRYDNVRNVCKRYHVPLFTTNNIPFIAEKLCDYIGIDKEAQKKANEEALKIIKAEFEKGEDV